MANDYDFDLFVIGGGSGGVRASRVAAGHGARVGIAESYRYGGTCVIRGCVPKKLLVHASHYAEDFEDAKGFGWSVPRASFSWIPFFNHPCRCCLALPCVCAAYDLTLDMNDSEME